MRAEAVVELVLGDSIQIEGLTERIRKKIVIFLLY